MSFLIEHQYVILYFSGAFFSFFAMLSYVKVGSVFVSGRRKMDNPEEFFEDFDNDDLEALLDESFDVDASSVEEAGGFALAGQDLEIHGGREQLKSESENKEFLAGHDQIKEQGSGREA